MYRKSPVITIDSYYIDMIELCKKINSNEFDCIIALKRSGFILGAFLSNQKTLPLFTSSEIKSIPAEFTRILIVDDKICTGKSLKRVRNKFTLASKITMACMYVESNVFPDIWVRDVKEICKMWYELN